MKFIDSIVSFGLKVDKRKPEFVYSKFWMRAFERESGVLVLFSKVQKTNPFVFEKISSSMANKLFKELKVVLGDYYWIEHFPMSTGKIKRPETFLKIEHRILGKKLCRIGERRVFLEQIEHWIGEELEMTVMPALENKNQIELEGSE